jgi:hypothetical protein
MTTPDQLKKFYESEIEQDPKMMALLPTLTTQNVAHDLKFLIDLFESTPKQVCFIESSEDASCLILSKSS